MSFTFNSPRKLDAEEANPYSNLISHAMDTYMKGQKAKYTSKQIEADIFAKEIGPLAALASSPNFTGINPEIQKMIAQRIGHHLGGAKNGQESPQAESTPGYANDEDIYNRLEKGAHATMGAGGQGALGKSRIAGGIENIFGKNPISEYLGGNKVAGENASKEQAFEEGVQKLKLKGYSETTARKALEPRPGENDESWIKRIRPLFISRENADSPIKSIDQKITRDEKERNQAMSGYKEAPPGSIGLYRNGELYYIPENEVNEALSQGFTYE